MSGVPMVSVGELMVSRGGSVNPLNFPDEDFDLYSIPAFDAGKPEVTVGADIGSTKQIIQPNDVLLSKIVPHIRRAWVVGEDRGRRLIGSGEWIVFRSERVWPEYLRHVLVGDPFHQQFMQTVSGVGGSLLRARPAFVAGISIPLPPLEEQRRIAAILDQAETLRSQRRQALAHLDTLTQSLFLDMFGDPVKGDGRYAVQAVETVASEARYSIVDGPFGSAIKQSDYLDSGIPVIRIGNLSKEGYYSPANLLYIGRTLFESLKRSNVLPGDVLISRVGTLGNTCIYPTDAGEALLSTTGVCKITVNQNVMLAEYLHAAIRCPTFQDQIQKSASTSVQKYFNLSALKSWRIVVPPLALQQTFATRIQAIEALKATHRTALAQLDALFASLQQRAFAGEL